MKPPALPIVDDGIVDDPGVIHVVCGACTNAQQRMLVHRRWADAAENGGRWEFPGGKIEPGESPTNALVREWQEELGVTPVVTDLLAVVYLPPHPATGRRYRIACYRVTLTPEQCRMVRPLASDAIAWVDVAHARELPGATAYAALCEALIIHLDRSLPTP